jgi:hypothetical protein
MMSASQKLNRAMLYEGVSARPATIPACGVRERALAAKATIVHVGCGSWPCKNPLPKEVDERPGSVQPQAAIAAISGLAPTMFMTRVRL